MRPEEEPAVLGLLETAFGLRAVFESYCRHDPAYRAEDFLLALDGDRPVSCVQIFAKRVRLRGTDVSLGGIGSVATAPSHRGRGLATELLERAIAEMCRRGMEISLLFSTIVDLYGPLGWLSVPQKRVSFHRNTAPTGAGRERSYRAGDREGVERLYVAYSESLETSTVRDGTYWDGQLRYAGNPDEEFRVAERDGSVVAYARRVRLYGQDVVMEYAREPEATEELAGILAGLAASDRPLVLSWADDAELFGALRRYADRLDPFDDPSLMWRVLDRPRLAALLGAVEPDASDETILCALLSPPHTLYWLSDRF
jgi:predicted N-acetyltransferase YhbS